MHAKVFLALKQTIFCALILAFSVSDLLPLNADTSDVAIGCALWQRQEVKEAAIVNARTKHGSNIR